MLRSATGHLRSTALAVAFGALAGCGGTSADVPVGPPALSAAEANARTTVPLTRTVALDKPGVIADLEFDLPPPGEFATTALEIGIRISANEAKSKAQLSDLIVSEGLPARVVLQRFGEGGPVDVALSRTAKDLRNRIPLESDGLVPGVMRADLDPSMLAEQGLEVDGWLSDVLSFARLEKAVPGRYKLSVELAEPRQQLAGKSAELIVAYKGRAK